MAVKRAMTTAAAGPDMTQRLGQAAAVIVATAVTAVMAVTVTTAAADDVAASFVLGLVWALLVCRWLPG